MIIMASFFGQHHQSFKGLLVSLQSSQDPASVVLCIDNLIKFVELQQPLDNRDRILVTKAIQEHYVVKNHLWDDEVKDRCAGLIRLMKTKVSTSSSQDSTRTSAVRSKNRFHEEFEVIFSFVHPLVLNRPPHRWGKS